VVPKAFRGIAELLDAGCGLWRHFFAGRPEFDTRISEKAPQGQCIFTQHLAPSALKCCKMGMLGDLFLWCLLDIIHVSSHARLSKSQCFKCMFWHQ